MTLQEAIAILSYSENIHDWNEKRDFIKSQLTENQWFKDYMPVIDASGLSVVVLGKD